MRTVFVHFLKSRKERTCPVNSYAHVRSIRRGELYAKVRIAPEPGGKWTILNYCEQCGRDRAWETEQ